MRRAKYTTEQLIEAVKLSTSMRQVLVRLNVAPYGGNYDVLRSRLKSLRLDTSHFLGRAWSRNRQLRSRTPLEHYLDGTQPVQSYKLKKSLLEAGLLTPQCGSCSLQIWLGQPIPLELDHVNGNNKTTDSKICACCVRTVTPSLRHTEARSAVRLSSGLQSRRVYSVGLFPRI